MIRLLRWSEKYTKTDMVYLARGGSWSVIGQIVTAIASLALSVIFSRYVSKDVYGNYKYILSVVGILSILSLNNLGTAVAQSAARGYDGALVEGFRQNLRWSILIFGGAAAIAMYYLFFGNVTLALGILLGGIVTPFLSSANLAGSFLAGKQDFPRATIYFGIVGVIIPALALIVTVILTKSLLWLIAVYFISNLAIDFYMYLRTTKAYDVHVGPRDEEMLSYGKHLSLMGLLGGIVGYLDQLLLFHFAGSVNLAIYAFAIGIIDQTKGPFKTLDKMIQARFANRKSEHIEEHMTRRVLLVFFVGLICAGAYIVIAPFLYHVLFPTYTESVPFSQVYALGLLGIGFIPFSSYFAAHKKIREQYTLNLVSGCLQIGFMSAGVILWGLWGLVIARISAGILNGVIAAFLYYITRRG
jgi:O-antigen/teichoic acid export membrane protein